MNEGNSLMDLFSDPNTIHSLSFGERMLGSTITMIMGLGITFTVLILIWLFIVIMGKVLDATKKDPAPAAAPAAPAAPAANAGPSAPAGMDESLVAVIAAAIAAYEGASADNLVVRKITRLEASQTGWEKAGIIARMDTRKM